MTTAPIQADHQETSVHPQGNMQGTAATGPHLLPHGLMFHHFHGPGLAQSQGSISGDTLAQIIDRYAASHNLLDAGEYLRRARSDQLEERDTCLTFDDSLLCQYEVALPVLQRYQLRAFWFVYSSVITGNIEVLEIYRRFRSEHFNDIDGFYAAFFDTVEESVYRDRVEERLANYSPRTYLADFPFYTDNDRKFRYIRDRALDGSAYEAIMNEMISASGTSAAELAEGLWMGVEQLRALHADGHIIGLHSHSHPTALADMSAGQQRQEYAHNQKVLFDILGFTPSTMSHPCNSYSGETLEVLASLGIDLGFRSNMTGGFDSRLEHPREDHANLVKRFRL